MKRLKVEVKDKSGKIVGWIYRTQNNDLKWCWYGYSRDMKRRSRHFFTANEASKWVLSSDFPVETNFTMLLKGDIETSGLSVVDVSYDIQVNPQSLKNWLAGAGVPKVLNLIALAKCLAVVNWESKYLEYSKAILEDDQCNGN